MRHATDHARNFERRHHRWTRILTLTAFALALGGAVNAWAGKKPSAPPPVVQPGSTIFFKHETTGDIYRMDDNGANKALMISFATQQAVTFDAVYNSPGNLAPSSRKYNGAHWWAWVGYREDGATYPGSTSPIREIFVGIPGDLDRTWRLTNLWDDHGIYTSTGPALTWSTDGNDSFLSFVGYRYTDPTPRSPSVYKIPFFVESTGGRTVPVTPWDAGLPTVIEAQIPLPSDYGNIDRHTWLPTDGATLLYGTLSNDSIPRLYRDSVWDVEAGTPPTLIWTNDLDSWHTVSATYSPDGGTIAFARFRSMFERDVLTIPAASAGLVGTNGTTTILTGRYMNYNQPTWSPSGAYLIAGEIDGRKGIDVSKFPRHLIRVTNTGGSLVRLTSDMAPLGNKYILGWRHGGSGDPAP